MKITKIKEKKIEDNHKWKNLPYLWIGRINIKKSILPKSIYRCNTISINIPIIPMTFSKI